MSRNDVGESTASINRRSDDETWPRTKAALEHSGCILHRPPRLDRYYARGKNGEYFSFTGLSKAAIRRLETEGQIEHAGFDTYILKRVAVSQ